ncbi:MAG: hypothetical protein Hals2KO_08870 [Halioglobus sp.]
MPTLLLAALLAACMGGNSSQEYLEDARKLVAEEKYKDAIVALKKSLSNDVHNTAARALLGKAYFETRDFRGAEKELTRALEINTDVDRSMVVPLLARTLMELGEFSRIDSLDVQGLDANARSMVLAAKSLARLFQGDEVVAEHLLASAREVDTLPLYTRIAIARFAMARQKYSAAMEELDAVLAEHPDYLPAWNLKGDILAARRLPKRAEEAYSKVLKISYRAFDARLNRAMMRIYLNNFTGAREDLRDLKKLHRGAASTHPGVSFAEGITLMQLGRYDKARKAFEKTADHSYAYPLSYYYMAVIDLQQKSLERALGEVYRFLALAPESVAGPKLAARLELEHGGYHEAEQLLEPLVEFYPKDVEALNLLATAKLGLGKGGEGVALLARVARLQPDSPRAQTRLGAGYFATGEIELGVEVLERTARESTTFEQADILLVLNFLREGRVEEAIAAAKDYKNRQPASTTSYNLLGRAYFAADQYSKSAWAFHKAIELDATDTAARHGLAEIALKRKQFNEARRYYKQVLKYNKDDLQTQLKLASSYALEGNEEIMLSMLEIAMDDHPESTVPLLMAIRYHMGADSLAEAAPLVDKLAAIERDQPDALSTLAAYQLATGRYNQALLTLERLLTIRPGVSQYHYMNAKAYSGLEDSENTLLELARTLEFEPDHFYAKLAMARLAHQTGKTELFRAQLKDLRQIAPQNIDLLKLELADAKQAGDETRVEQLLLHLYVKWPSTESVLDVADYRFSRRDAKGALDVLRTWLAEHPDDIEVHLRIARMYEEMGRLKKARESYEKTLEIEHDNLIALNNFAWILLDSDPRLALRYAQKAHDLAPGSASVLDTLAMAQLKSGSPAEANRTLQRALEIAPRNPQLLFHAAQIMLASGEHQEAADALNQVLKKHPRFAARSEAQALLNSIQQTAKAAGG